MHALGFPTDRLPSKNFQGTPMRHRGGVHAGNFHLVEKAGGEAFTDEDEVILVLFVSQAATAIANARTYRAEQRARADLEALCGVRARSRGAGLSPGAPGPRPAARAPAPG